MTPKHPDINMHNGETNGKTHMYLGKQVPVNMDTIVSFVKQGIEGGIYLLVASS